MSIPSTMPIGSFPWREYCLAHPDKTAIRLLQEQSSEGKASRETRTSRETKPASEVTLTWAKLCAKVDLYRDQLFNLLEQQQLFSQVTQPVVVVRSANRASLIYLLLAASELGVMLLIANPKLAAFSDIVESLGHSVSLDLEHPELEQIEDVVELLSTQDTLPVDSGHTELPQSSSRVVSIWDAQRPLTLTLTSGSTGLPKAVVHSAATHLASAEGLLSLLPLDSDDDWLLSLPLYHISGMAIVWRWLAAGAILTLPSRDINASLEQVTHASLVPTQLQRFLTEKPSHHLKQILLGGAAIPVELVQQAKVQGIDCWCGYGMTEMASTVTMKQADHRAGVGQLIPRRELKLREGELYLRGHTLCLGYLKAGQIIPTTVDGWFASKDLATWCGNEWRIIGRKDNMFISGGENVQPEAIESQLASFEGVSRVMVLPIDDAEFGQRPVAIIETTRDLSELKAWSDSQLPGFQRPKFYYSWPSHFDGGGIKVSRVEMAKWLEAKIKAG